mmetsp:Transcript_19112/g.41103  ORF Transcript_19112/g.41103 Transcript_19112/m.41103 type:complete len:233 (-) Transcript_19112:20-718(-)
MNVGRDRHEKNQGKGDPHGPVQVGTLERIRRHVAHHGGTKLVGQVKLQETGLEAGRDIRRFHVKVLKVRFETKTSEAGAPSKNGLWGRAWLGRRRRGASVVFRRGRTLVHGARPGGRILTGWCWWWHLLLRLLLLKLRLSWLLLLGRRFGQVHGPRHAREWIGLVHVIDINGAGACIVESILACLLLLLLLSTSKGVRGELVAVRGIQHGCCLVVLFCFVILFRVVSVLLLE